MHKMLLYRFFGILLLISFSVNAQMVKKSSISVETDPLTSLLGGKTIWIIYEPKTSNHINIGGNLFSSNFKESIDNLLNPKNKGKGFSTKIPVGGGISVDYYFNKKRDRYYVSIINLLFQNEVKFSAETKTFTTHNIFSRVGYRWHPFIKKKLYLNPFLGLRFEYAFNKIKFQSQNVEYEPAGIQPFGSIHIGYKF